MDEHGQAVNDDPDRARPPQRGKDERRIGKEKKYKKPINCKKMFTFETVN